MGSSVTLTQDELLFLRTKNNVGLTYSLLKVSRYKIIMHQTNQHLTRLFYVQSSRSNLKHLVSIFFGVALVYFLKNGRVGQVT